MCRLTLADGRDSKCLPSITTELQTRLKENELLMATYWLMLVTLMITTTAFWSEKASWAGYRFWEIQSKNYRLYL